MGTQFDWGSNLPELQGRKVQLRPVADDDAADILAVFGDPDVMRYWSSAPLPDIAAATALIHEIQAAFSKRVLFQWAISLSDTHRLLGTCTLLNLERTHRRAEVGFALRRDAWGRGLATDALTTVIHFAFNRLDLHRLEADADPRNERSLRTLERQGFRKEGHLRERWHHLGEVQDAIFLGLLRREWSGGDAAQQGVATDGASPRR
jgi:RimJ/RimL family protein N-acetyltransferase